MRLSLKGLVFLGCLAAVGGALLFADVLLDHSLRGWLLESAQEQMVQKILLAREVVKGRLPAPVKAAQADALADELGDLLGARVSILDVQGHLLGDSMVPLAELDSQFNQAKQPEVTEAVQKGLGQSMRFSPLKERQTLFAAVRLDISDQPPVVVRMAAPADQATKGLSQIPTLLLAAFGLGALISVFVALWAARTVGGRIKAMAGTAKAIASGALSARYRRYPDPVMGDLGRSFDRMADSLQESIADLTRDRDRLEAVLRGMSEGVLVTDKQGRVLLANQALLDLLDVRQNPTGRMPSEIIRNADLVDAMRQARQGASHVYREIRVVGPSPRFLEVRVVRLSGPADQAGCVAVLHDFTDRKRTEEIRRDFVANVSHELRTPLTAIRGSAETLLDGALDSPEDARRFVEMIARQSERLVRLAQDLLDLSRIESGESALDRKEIKSREFAETLVAMVGGLAKDRGVDLKVRGPKESFAFLADRPKLEQAVLNLLDNAIKYTEPGGKVALRLHRKEREVHIEVKDSGLGISSEDLPRIFERFYRVDKTRSREMGGTGLGLAIVKHLVQLHKGRVEVESEPGKGSTFRIVLPHGKPGK